MRKFLMPLLVAFAFPVALNSEEISDEKMNEGIHNFCLKSTNYENCIFSQKKNLEILENTTKAMVSFKKGNREPLSYLLDDICLAGEKGYIKDTRSYVGNVISIYKEFYPASKKDKELFCVSGKCAREDVLKIYNYLNKNFPNCVKKNN